MSKVPKIKPIKRPYATQYYADADEHHSKPTMTSQGAASTERGAIRASVVRIFMGEFSKAIIYDRIKEIPIYTVKVGAHGLQIHYGLAKDDNKAKLHRVK